MLTGIIKNEEPLDVFENDILKKFNSYKILFVKSLISRNEKMESLYLFPHAPS